VQHEFAPLQRLPQLLLDAQPADGGAAVLGGRRAMRRRRCAANGLQPMHDVAIAAQHELQEVAHQRVGLAHALGDMVPIQALEAGRVDRDDRRRAIAAVEQGHLADERSRSKLGEHVARAGALDGDLEAASFDDIRAVAGVTFSEQHLSGRELALERVADHGPPCVRNHSRGGRPDGLWAEMPRSRGF
jgi:hypothetical protein